MGCNPFSHLVTLSLPRTPAVCRSVELHYALSFYLAFYLLNLFAGVVFFSARGLYGE